MRSTRFTIAIATGLCSMVVVGILGSEAPWLARESIFEFMAREPENKNPAEPDAPPKGGLTTPSANSGAAEEPPSASGTFRAKCA